jgi:hypothetical protein
MARQWRHGLRPAYDTSGRRKHDDCAQNPAYPAHEDELLAFHALAGRGRNRIAQNPTPQVIDSNMQDLMDLTTKALLPQADSRTLASLA